MYKNHHSCKKSYNLMRKTFYNDMRFGKLLRVCYAPRKQAYRKLFKLGYIFSYEQMLNKVPFNYLFRYFPYEAFYKKYEDVIQDVTYKIAERYLQLFYPEKYEEFNNGRIKTREYLNSKSAVNIEDEKNA